MAVPRTARKMKLRPQRHAPRTGRGLSEWTDLRATLSSSLRLLSALYTRRTICQAPFARVPRIFRKFPGPVQNAAAAKNGQNSLTPYHIYRFDTRPTVHPAASAAPSRSLSRQARRSFSGRQCPQGKRTPIRGVIANGYTRMGHTRLRAVRLNGNQVSHSALWTSHQAGKLGSFEE